MKEDIILQLVGTILWIGSCLVLICLGNMKWKRSDKTWKTAQDRYKSYADRKRLHNQLKLGNMCIWKWNQKELLETWEVHKACSYILWTIWGLIQDGPMAYQLAFPANLKIHNVFHVSMLNKYVYYPNYIIDWAVIQVKPEG